MTRSTPDALWSAAPLRSLRPAAVSVSNLRRGRQLRSCSLTVPVGARVLVVSEPDSTASVLVRVLAGLVRPHGGRIRIAGSVDPSVDGWGRRVAYVGPEPGVHPWLSPREALTLAADLLELPARDRRQSIDGAAEWARIPPGLLDEPIRRVGAALQQRTDLAAALLGEPEVVLFDHPLRALDRGERVGLLRLPGRRRTVLIATPAPQEVAEAASHVVYLRDGRVRLIAALSDLERAGLPLSPRGLDALAARRASGSAPVTTSAQPPA